MLSIHSQSEPKKRFSKWQSFLEIAILKFLIFKIKINLMKFKDCANFSSVQALKCKEYNITYVITNIIGHSNVFFLNVGFRNLSF